MSTNLVNEFKQNLFNLDDITQELFKQKVHIKVRQRTARSYITSIEGLDTEIDLKKLAKHFKKVLNCSGNIDVSTGSSIIKLSGDHRYKVKELLIEQGIVTDDDIIIHGV